MSSIFWIIIIIIGGLVLLGLILLILLFFVGFTSTSVQPSLSLPLLF